MAKIYMTCGRLCSGKSTYARLLRDKLHGVILSVDELMIDILGKDCGEMHDEYVKRTELFLYKKSSEIVSQGIDVILDLGFWTREERDHARKYFSSLGIGYEFHYIDISGEEWKKRIENRNSLVSAGVSSDYYVDTGLMEKFLSVFEKPSCDETDLIKIFAESSASESKSDK